MNWYNYISNGFVRKHLNICFVRLFYLFFYQTLGINAVHIELYNFVFKIENYKSVNDIVKVRSYIRVFKPFLKSIQSFNWLILVSFFFLLFLLLNNKNVRLWDSKLQWLNVLIFFRINFICFVCLLLLVTVHEQERKQQLIFTIVEQT